MIHSSFIEYRDLVMVGQTHSLSVHNRHYNMSNAYRKRKLETGFSINQSYQRITNNSSDESNDTLPVTIENQDNDQLSDASNPLGSIERILQEQFQMIPAPVYQFSNGPTPETIRAMNDLDFGLARKDLDKGGKRFEWLKEEIDYLVYYIQTIESETTNRYANCLNHLRTEASTEVKKYFHPHHVVNSDRLKNGFNVALKKL